VERRGCALLRRSPRGLFRFGGVLRRFQGRQSGLDVFDNRVALLDVVVDVGDQVDGEADEFEKQAAHMEIPLRVRRVVCAGQVYLRNSVRAKSVASWS
jgi:hypothetical protein